MGASAAQAFVPAPAPEPPSPEDDFDDEATVLSDNPLQFLANAEKAKAKPHIPSPRKPATGPFAKANAGDASLPPKATAPIAKPPAPLPAPIPAPSVEPPEAADDASLDLRFSMPMEAPIEAPAAPSDPFGLGDSSPGDLDGDLDGDLGGDFGSAPLDEPLSGGFAPPPEEEEDDEAAVILAGAMPLSRSGGIPIGAWIAIAGAMAFGVALAVVVGTKLMQEPTPVAVVTPPEETPTPAEAEVEVPEPEVADEGTDVADEIEAATDPESETDAPNMTGRTKRVRSRDRTGTMTEPAPTVTMMDDNLTPAQRALLEEMSRGDDTTSVMTAGLGRMTTMRGEPLSADAVRRVVNNNSNQRALRRCYETSIRGMPSPPTVRFDVRVSVGPSGTVTSVRAAGSNEISGLKPCIERAVRRWRFPSSSGGATPQFPLVFHGAG